MRKNTLEKKYCPKCDRFYSREEFYKNRAAKDGLMGYCKTCAKKLNREEKLSKQKHYTEYDKIRHRLRRFNLTWDNFQKMIADQNELCKICQNPLIGKFVVDHDHSCCEGRYSCGKCIRGILCNSCNTGLGHFKDNPDILKSAIKYLVN